MRIITYLSTVCLLVLQWSVIYAQQSLDEVKKQAYGNPFNDANASFLNMVNDMETGGTLSLLLFPRWETMEIFGKDTTHVVVDSANYHVRDDRVLFVENGTYYELYPERIDSIRVGNRAFVHSQYKVRKKKLGASYFEVLEDGDIALLCQHTLKREVTNDNTMGLRATRKVRWRHFKTLYYRTRPTARPEPVPIRKRDLIHIFRRNTAKMVAFAIENNISPRNHDEVRTLFAYYNSLVDER